MIEEIKEDNNCIVKAFENNPIAILHEDINNKNCKSEYNYAFTTNKNILYVIFSNISGLREADVNRRFGAVGFRMAGSLFFKYDPSNFKPLLKAINEVLNSNVSYL